MCYFSTIYSIFSKIHCQNGEENRKKRIFLTPSGKYIQQWSHYRWSLFITLSPHTTISRDNRNDEWHSTTMIRWHKLEPQKENASLQRQRSVFTHATIIRELFSALRVSRNSLFKLCIKRAKERPRFPAKAATRRARTNQRIPAISRDGEALSSAYRRLGGRLVSSGSRGEKGHSMKFFSPAPTRWTRWGRNPRIIERLKSWGEGLEGGASCEGGSVRMRGAWMRGEGGK